MKIANRMENNMENIYGSVEELVGKTPLVLLGGLSSECEIFAKLEGKNPGGSAKDRVAVRMLDDAEKQGVIKPGSVIIEPTSGNTGIGLAMIGAARGYRVIIVMPDTMSEERRRLIAAYGAELVLTDGALGMSGAIEKAEELSREIPSAFIPAQFDNPSNPMAHFDTTGPEIWEDTAGKVDIFVAGIGTGGTISGVGRYLKSKNQSIRIVGVEPKSSPVISEGRKGTHGIQGIGAGFIPKNLDLSVVDRVVSVTEEESYEAARTLAKHSGILAGISSGAALFAAIKLSCVSENKGKRIVVLLPDAGDRYLSTPLFE